MFGTFDFSKFIDTLRFSNVPFLTCHNEHVTVSFKELLRAYRTEVLLQAEIDWKHVVVLATNIAANGLLNPIQIGFTDESFSGKFRVVSGRNRLMAIMLLKLVQQFGKIDTSLIEELEDDQIPVTRTIWSLQAIEAGNSTRRMSATEKGLLAQQMDGLELTSSMGEVLQQVLNKKLKPQVAYQNLVATHTTESALTLHTRGQLGKRLYTALKERKLLPSIEDVSAHIKILQHVASNIDAYVQKVVSRGFTNIARDGLPIVTMLILDDIENWGVGDWCPEPEPTSVPSVPSVINTEEPVKVKPRARPRPKSLSKKTK